MAKNKIVVIILLLLLAGCNQNNEVDRVSQQEPVELMISAASSLTDVLTEMKTIFEEEYKNVKITMNFGGSGKLALQIEQGAPVDLFLSADSEWMDQLEQKSLVLPKTRVNFARNSIVLVGQKNKESEITSIEDINEQDFDFIAIGEPESVPVGKYTKEVLQELGKWDSLQSKLVLAKDVRQVLAYVESGNADVGFVYSTDAYISDQITILDKADSSLHSPIIYPAGVMTDSMHQTEAKQFIDFLQSEKGQRILEKYGFKNNQ